MLIAIANPKGGSGKSTIATNFAAMHAARKARVKLFDADGQRSSGKWVDLRTSLGVRPRIWEKSMTGDIYDTLKAEAADADITIVDVGGKRSPELTLALSLADMVLVPVMTSQFDLWALDDAAALVSELRNEGAQLRAYSILTNTPYHKQSRPVKVARKALEAYTDAFEPCETRLIGRGVFEEALLCGLAVTEVDGGLRDVKATAELNQLFEELFHG